MKRQVKIIAALAALCLFCAGCNMLSSPADVAAAKTRSHDISASPGGQPQSQFLNVGIKTYQIGLDWWPSGQDDPNGFEWSMISTILGNLGYNIRAVPMTSDNWEQKLDTGAVTLAVGSISYTGPRLARYLLAGPYMDGELAVLTFNASRISLNPEEPLQGQRVCYVKSVRTDEPTTAQLEIARESTTVSFQQTTAISTLGCLQALQHHHATVFLSDAAILRGIAVHAPSVYTSNDLGGQFGEQQEYMIAFQRTPAMSALCKSIDQTLPTYLNQSWWTDFSKNLAGTMANQQQLEEEYLPAASDIQPQMCDLDQG